MKGQVAIEFFVYSALFLFIVVSAYFLITFIQNAEIPQKHNVLVKELGYSFADAFVLADRGGAGLEYAIRFPKTILGTSYSISMYRRSSSELPNLLIETNISQAEYSHLYSLPNTNYVGTGTCWTSIFDNSGGIVGYRFDSKNCDNRMFFENTGPVINVRVDR